MPTISLSQLSVQFLPSHSSMKLALPFGLSIMSMTFQNNGAKQEPRNDRDVIEDAADFRRLPDTLKHCISMINYEENEVCQ